MCALVLFLLWLKTEINCFVCHQLKHCTCHIKGLDQRVVSSLQQLLKQHIFERLHSRLTHVLEQRLDMDYLDFICTQEMVFISALARHIEMPQEVMNVLTELSDLIEMHQQDHQQPPRVVQVVKGPFAGRPKLILSEEFLIHLIDIGLPVPCIAKLAGLSRRTVCRRMQENSISVRELYSTLTDKALDEMVSEIKLRMPHAGYRIVKGTLLAEGHRVQWNRVRASMHRVDTMGVLSRMTQLGCVVRRTYSVPCPRYLVHIDMNHKLIR